MMLNYVLSALLVILVYSGFTNGYLRKIRISQANYATIAVKVVTSDYQAMLKEAKDLQLQTKLTACYTKAKKMFGSCKTCVGTIESCGGGLSPVAILFAVAADPRLIKPLAQMGLNALGNQIGAGAKSLYNKYGIGPVGALKGAYDKISSFGGGLISGFSTGFNIGYNKIKSIFSKFGGFPYPFGKRRRRSDGLSESMVVRERRAESKPSAEDIACINKKCADCSPFMDRTMDQAYRTICGDDLVNKNATLSAKIDRVTKFYTDLTKATQDILKEVWVETTTGRVAKVVVLKGTEYKVVTVENVQYLALGATKYFTYQPSSVITIDPYDQDPGVKALAQFIYSTY